MQQKQAGCAFQFVPDLETQKILDSLAVGTKDGYINDAIKAFARSAAPKSAPSGGNSPVDQVNTELKRIFGDSFNDIAASSSEKANCVALTQSRTQLRAVCGFQDAFDILKSLRQPISAEEVWEIISVLG